MMSSEYAEHNARNITERRRTYILHMLTNGIIVLSFLALYSSATDIPIYGMQYDDVTIYAFSVTLIALVSWISNRQLGLLLKRTQIREFEELNRFAEFGRISSTMLHELANPLTTAAINIELIKTAPNKNLYKELEKCITYMEESVTSARRQLRGESDNNPFNIDKEIQRVADFLQPKAQESYTNITTVFDQTIILTGDRLKFNQIISNLLLNAIDAHEALPEKSPKSIEISSRQIGNMVEVNVRDYGIGISREDLPHIFKPFFSTKLLERGTGLGLTITKRAIERDFGGSISASSSHSTGTTFTIVLKRDPPKGSLFHKFGASYGNRTHDLRNHNPTL